MSKHQLSLDDLVRGLEYFGERYEALDVFTRDLQEVGRMLMERRDEPAFVFERGGRSYKLRFHPSGIARLTRARQETPGPAERQAMPGPLSAALAATSLNQWLPAAVVGFLVGGPLTDRPDPLRRMFTMHYDPSEGGWCAYDGPLLELLREKRREAEATFRSAG